LRRTLRLASLALLVPSAAFAQQMFRGNPAHTGVYETTGPRRLDKVRWTFSTGAAVVSSPAVANGVVYVGSDDKNLYAIDARRGEKKWAFATGGLVRSSPAVAAGTVFFGSYDGVFYALDAADGKVRWKIELPGERKFEAKGLHGVKPRAQTVPDFWDFFLSSPAVVGGSVFFGSGDGNVYAVDAETGQVRWKFATGNVVHSSPAVVDGTVFVGSWDTFLYAIDAQSGREKWRFKTGEDEVNFNQVGIQSSPAVVDGVVYFGCRDGHLYALDAARGRELWRFRTKPSWINTSPAIHDGLAYVGNPIPGLFRAVDLATGQERFHFDAKFMIFSSPAVTRDGMAYFGAFTGKLYAVDARRGVLVSEFQTEASRRNAFGVLGPDGRPSPTAFGRSDFFEEVYRAGERLFSLGAILSSPTVVDGVIYVGSTDGNVYALE
jgi:outer membrane protein assembly factor BamB